MKDSFRCKKQLTCGGIQYTYFCLKEAERGGLAGVGSFPFSLKVLLENLLRFEDEKTVCEKDIRALADWGKQRKSSHEIAFRPARVLMQDFTGVPAIVDLAAMRDAVVQMGGLVKVINPLIPVDLVVDHSITVEKYGNAQAMRDNTAIEYKRNFERYAFLKWGSKAFNNFRVVSPGTGICHQVNLEYLAQTVICGANNTLYPDTCIGTDSHTPMVNALGVLGWGVGGIEAEAAMLGEPISMVIPEVVGVRLVGRMKPGTTATDLVLTVTNILRQKGVVGKFVEFMGEGLSQLSLEDRATVSNMTPEYGATVGFFPIDQETLDYLERTNRSQEHIDLVEAYAKAQGLFHEPSMPEAQFTDIVELDLSTLLPSIAGPKRPQDKILLDHASEAFKKLSASSAQVPKREEEGPVKEGDVVIAAITSCTNTSNPDVMVAAALLAKNAVEKGLKTKPWVKTSLAPGSKVVTDYLNHSGLQQSLDALGFNLVGYGCTTCIGNSGPLREDISKHVQDSGLTVVSVLSGNRNFEARVNPDVRANYLMSPPLVVAYALAGSMLVDLTKSPLGEDKQGAPVYLKDIWPNKEDIRACVKQFITKDLFKERYSQVFDGDEEWQKITCKPSETYMWDAHSTYVQKPTFFENMSRELGAMRSIENAHILGIFGDSVTTDHISPAGAIAETSPAGQYLKAHGVEKKDFNSYGTRRGNHEVMIRGTFANPRIKNLVLPGVEGGVTLYNKQTVPIFEAAQSYGKDGTPLVVLAGKEYGSGSSRDWAAKGPFLLGVRVVIAMSFERIHRSNLVGMGILPLQMDAAQLDGKDWVGFGIQAEDTFTVRGLEQLRPKAMLTVEISRAGQVVHTLQALCRIDTAQELMYYKNGGILPFELRELTA